MAKMKSKKPLKKYQGGGNTNDPWSFPTSGLANPYASDINYALGYLDITNPNQQYMNLGDNPFAAGIAKGARDTATELNPLISSATAPLSQKDATDQLIKQRGFVKSGGNWIDSSGNKYSNKEFVSLQDSYRIQENEKRQKAKQLIPLATPMFMLNELGEQQKTSYNLAQKEGFYDVTKSPLGMESKGFFARDGMKTPSILEVYRMMGADTGVPTSTTKITAILYPKKKEEGGLASILDNLLYDENNSSPSVESFEQGGMIPKAQNSLWTIASLPSTGVASGSTVVSNEEIYRIGEINRLARQILKKNPKDFTKEEVAILEQATIKEVKKPLGNYRIARANEARKAGWFASPKKFAEATSAIGDKLSLQRLPIVGKYIPDELDVPKHMGNLASGIAAVPYNVQQGNYGAAARDIVLPLVTGAIGGLGARTTGQFVNQMVNPLAGMGNVLRPRPRLGRLPNELERYPTDIPYPTEGSLAPLPPPPPKAKTYRKAYEDSDVQARAAGASEPVISREDYYTNREVAQIFKNRERKDEIFKELSELYPDKSPKEVIENIRPDLKEDFYKPTNFTDKFLTPDQDEFVRRILPGRGMEMDWGSVKDKLSLYDFARGIPQKDLPPSEYFKSLGSKTTPEDLLYQQGYIREGVPTNPILYEPIDRSNPIIPFRAGQNNKNGGLVSNNKIFDMTNQQNQRTDSALNRKQGGETNSINYKDTDNMYNNNQRISRLAMMLGGGLVRNYQDGGMQQPMSQEEAMMMEQAMMEQQAMDQQAMQQQQQPMSQQGQQQQQPQQGGENKYLQLPPEQQLEVYKQIIDFVAESGIDALEQQYPEEYEFFEQYSDQLEGEEDEGEEMETEEGRMEMRGGEEEMPSEEEIMMMEQQAEQEYPTDEQEVPLGARPGENSAREPMQPQQMKQGGIPERYRNMGFSKVGAKKQSNRPGKKWMVLAKKGDQYKVVHGGDSNMKDFTQHGSKKRQEAFWDRMGGRNSAKAKDPFSPLYWHKRFKTW
jgi:hypothetical protein